MDRQERQTVWPKDALGPFPPKGLSLGVPLEPTTAGPSPRNQAGQKGGGWGVLHSIGRCWGRWAKMRPQLLAVFPSCWGLELFFGTIPFPWRWEEEGEKLGI